MSHSSLAGASSNSDLSRLRQQVPKGGGPRARADLLFESLPLDRTPGRKGAGFGIAFGDLLPPGTAVYDLTVEEDASFVIEGFVAHNTNCKCSWEFETTEGGVNAYWRLGIADHCPDCLAREKAWNPYFVAGFFEGPGRGWWGPPKGTHGLGSQGGTGGYDTGDESHFVNTLGEELAEKYKPFVSAYTVKEYKEMGARTFISESGKSGFALKPDGDIISVFSGAKGEGSLALKAAIREGGAKLDCFDGFLAKTFYPMFGFAEIDRWAWDDQYAPEGWDYEEYNHPDVVFMELGNE